MRALASLADRHLAWARALNRLALAVEAWRNDLLSSPGAARGGGSRPIVQLFFAPCLRWREVERAEDQIDLLPVQSRALQAEMTDQRAVGPVCERCRIAG